MTIKQVIVVRRDLKMRRGKEVAQGAHASGAILEQVAFEGKSPSSQLIQWLNTGKTKITVRVDSEQELLQVYQKALQLRLDVNLITDSGKTEFNGVPTKTCLAIGPDNADKIDLVTGHLPLY